MSPTDRQAPAGGNTAGIVSLLPAATEIVCALGLRERLLARSHECDHPADVLALPALTRARVDSSLPSDELDAQVREIVARRLPLYMLDEARLAALAPEVVVTQEACEVCAISYDQVVGSLRRTAARARVVSLQPSRLDQVLDDVQAVAAACGVPARGEALRAELRARLSRIPRPAVRPRMAVVEWLGPPMLAGHWTADVIAAAGAEPVGLAPGAPSAYATWDEVRALQLDAAVVAPCGFDLERTRREAEPLHETLRTLAPRVLLLDGNAYINRPGPRLVDAAEMIAAWLGGRSLPTADALDLGVREDTGVRGDEEPVRDGPAVPPNQ
jgi:iron complex transport system substrate-binding protein